MTDSSGYLPPHELRSLSTNIVDNPQQSMPTPGVGPAVVAPTGFAPTLPSEDPALAMLLAQVLDPGGSSVMPMSPTSQVPTGSALPTPGLAIPQPLLSPGITPTLEPMGAGVSPVIVPMAPQSPSPTAPSVPAWPSSFDEELRIPFTGDQAPSSLEARHVLRVPFGELPVKSVPPSFPSAPPTRDLGEDVRVPMLGDHGPVTATHEVIRVPFGVDDKPNVTQRDRRAPFGAEETGQRRDHRAPGDPPIRQSSGGAFDPYAARADIPILQERVHGKRLVWLDNAATTQKPRAVIDRISQFYEHENSNVHRAAHALAARATDAYEGARETTRKFLNAPSASEIIFVRGATEGINLIAKTWGVRHLERGDEIVITHLEHHANIVPWQQLCAVTGAKLRVAPVAAT